MAFVTDNFARPDGSLGPNWATPIPNHAEFQPWTGTAAGNVLISNQGFGPDATNGLDCACLWAGGQSFGNDQWATTQIKTVAPPTAILSITAASQSAGNTTYTYTVSSGSVAAAISGGALYVIISGMAHAGNNGRFTATTFGAGTFTVANANGVTATENGTGFCPSDSGGGVGVRMSGTSIATLNGYFYHVGTNSFSGDGRRCYHELWRVVNGVGTILFGVDAADTGLPAPGDLLAISAIGTTISCYINGYLLAQVTDATIASGVPGLWTFAVSGTKQYVWSTWNDGGTTQFGGNNGTTFNNFQAGDTPFNPALSSTQIATESFTEFGNFGTHDLVPYANGDLHSANANWVYQGSSTFNISSGSIYSSSAGLNFAYRSDISAPTNDQWSEVVVTIAGTSATQNGGPAVRVSAATQTAYVLQLANNTAVLSKVVSGALTPLGSLGGTAPVTGDRFRLTVVGTTLNVYQNEVKVLGPITDASISSGNIGIFDAGNSNTNGFSKWAGGSMTMLTATTNFAQLANQATALDSINGAFAIQPDASNLAEAYESTLTWLGGQYSEAVVTGVSAGSTCGPLTRGGVGGNGYFFGPFGNNVFLFRTDSDVPVQIATVAHTYAAGEIYRLEAIGSTLVCKINGTILIGPITEGTYLTGRPGLMFSGFGDGLVAKNSFKNWAGGQLAAGTTPYSVPDCRVTTATTPNSSRNVQSTLIYDVPKVDSRAAGAPVDSRVSKPVDCRISSIVPINSRTPGVFGPGE